MGMEMKLMHDYLFPSGTMEPGTAEEQKTLLERAAKLAYPWPADDGSGVFQPGTYGCDELTLTIEPVEDGVLPVTIAPGRGRRAQHAFGRWASLRLTPGPAICPARLICTVWRPAAGTKER